MNDLKYKVRYGILPSRKIYNHINPYLSEDRDPVKYIRMLNNENGFYIKLEESVLKDGFKNPILVVAGHENIIAKHKLPDEMRKTVTKALVCNASGGSRLWIAQKYNMDIPCLISDFTNCFPEFPAMTELCEIIKYYNNSPPQEIGMNEDGLWIRNLPHIHLGDKTYKDRIKNGGR